MKKICSLLFIAFVFPIAAYANSCNSGSCYAEIQALYSPNSEFVYIGTAADETALGCNPVSNVYIKLYKSHANFSEIYAGLLAAQAQNRKVKVRISPSINDCTVAYVVTYNY